VLVILAMLATIAAPRVTKYLTKQNESRKFKSMHWVPQSMRFISTWDAIRRKKKDCSIDGEATDALGWDGTLLEKTGEPVDPCGIRIAIDALVLTATFKFFRWERTTKKVATEIRVMSAPNKLPCCCGYGSRLRAIGPNVIELLVVIAILAMLAGLFRWRCSE